MLYKTAISSVAAGALTLFSVGGHASSAPGHDSPAYYPAPYGGWVDEWRDSYSKAKQLVDSMTLAEKTNITAGTGIFMGKSRYPRSEPRRAMRRWLL